MDVKRRAVAAANAAALLALFSAGTQAKLSQNRDATSFGNTTQGQILDKTDRLCREIIPITHPANLKADKLTSYGRNGAPRHFWTVDCYNSNSDLVHVCWNADSGEMTWVSRQTDEVGPWPPAAISRSSGIRFARYWLLRLEIPKAGENWRVAGSPELVEYRWRINCVSGKRTATIVIDAATGDLVTAKIPGA